MENLKIEVVGDEAKSKEAQELFFKLGYDWVYTTMVNVTVGIIYSDRDGYLTVNPVSGIRDYKETTLQELRDKVVLKRNDVNDATHVRYDGKKYFHAKSTDYFYHFSNDKEWLLSNWMNDQLLPQLKPIQESKMTAPQHKEYLDPQNNYELIEWDGGFMIQEHWIEVPANAEVMTMPNAYFWKRGSENYAWNGKEWNNNNGEDLCSYLERGCNAKIVWQRNAGKEYLDPTDNYKLITTPSPMSHWVEVPAYANFAEYDDMRKELYFSPIHLPFGHTVWQRHTQPNQTTIDAMNADTDSEVHGSADELFASISLESTLAERQSTYGDFRDVANTTGQLMGILRNSKNGHTLPYVHEEALHMICSKMARLVNGDCNHKDSWHDIAGYAKLVEDSL